MTCNHDTKTKATALFDMITMPSMGWQPSTKEHIRCIIQPLEKARKRRQKNSLTAADQEYIIDQVRYFLADARESAQHEIDRRHFGKSLRRIDWPLRSTRKRSTQKLKRIAALAAKLSALVDELDTEMQERLYKNAKGSKANNDAVQEVLSTTGSHFVMKSDPRKRLLVSVFVAMLDALSLGAGRTLEQVKTAPVEKRSRKDAVASTFFERLAKLYEEVTGSWPRRNLDAYTGDASGTFVALLQAVTPSWLHRPDVSFEHVVRQLTPKE